MKVDEEWKPKEDWPTRRPSGQLLYANIYNTGVHLNHKEKVSSPRERPKDGGSPYGDRRRREK